MSRRDDDDDDEHPFYKGTERQDPTRGYFAAMPVDRYIRTRAGIYRPPGAREHRDGHPEWRFPHELNASLWFIYMSSAEFTDGVDQTPERRREIAGLRESRRLRKAHQRRDRRLGKPTPPTLPRPLSTPPPDYNHPPEIISKPIPEYAELNKLLLPTLRVFYTWASANRYNTPEGAEDGCLVAADSFAEMLPAELNASLEVFSWNIKQDAEEYPLPSVRKRTTGGHIVVRVGPYLIDWAARRFHPHAPFPMAWLCPVREWRTCT